MTEFSHVMVDENLLFSETSPLLLTTPGFGARLRVEWKHLAARTGRADHEQPFKRLRRCLRLPRLVLEVVLALCTSRNPASVKAPCASAPLFFCLKLVCFLEAERNLWLTVLSRVPAHRWEGLVMFPLCQQRGRDNFKRSEEQALQAPAAPPRCWWDALTKSFWHHTRASPSECIHSFMGLSAGYCVCPWPSGRPYILCSSLQTGYDLLLFLNVGGVTFQQGTRLCRGLARRIWLCSGFGPRWREAKEQEFFILRKGFKSSFRGSNVTCMWKVLNAFNAQLFLSVWLFMLPKLVGGVRFTVKEYDYCLFQ